MSIFNKAKNQSEETKPAAPAVSAANAASTPSKPSRAHQVLLKPLVTEKAAHLAHTGKYVFMVATDANKIEVKKAVQALYNVTPVNVRMISMSGVATRYGRSSGRTKDWKKAIVTLKAGEKIALYEGV